MNNFTFQLKKYVVQNNFDQIYETRDKLGAGSYAEVFLLEDRLTHTKYAGKIFNLQALPLKNAHLSKAALRNEVVIQRKLEHENIVRLYEIYETEAKVIIVMEYVQGRRLLDYVIEHSPISEKKSIPLMKQIVDATIYIHSFGIIHRDIKLENMMIVNERGKGDDKPIIKLLDFGLAVYEDNIEFLKKSGTPGYVAPEILTSETYDNKVDVFSIGVILYTMLSGRSPFVGPDRKTVLILNKRCEIVFRGRYWNNKSINAKDLVKKVMEADPNRRIGAKQILEHPWLTLVYLNGVQPLVNIPKIMNVSNSHIFAAGTIRLKSSNPNLNTPRSRKKSASETTFENSQSQNTRPGLPGLPGIPVHDRNDRRKSSTVDTGRSVSVKNFEGRTRVGSYHQNFLQIPVQTPTHNPNQAPIISAWAEADKLDISSLEDGLNRNSIRTFYKVSSSSNYESNNTMRSVKSVSEVSPTFRKRLEKSTTLDDEIAKENPDIKSRLNSHRGLEVTPRQSSYADWSQNFPTLSGIPETKEDKQSCEMSLESLSETGIQKPKKGFVLKALTPRLKGRVKVRVPPLNL